MKLFDDVIAAHEYHTLTADAVNKSMLAASGGQLLATVHMHMAQPMITVHSALRDDVGRCFIVSDGSIMTAENCMIDETMRARRSLLEEVLRINSNPAQREGE